jgi:hypothetical protein
MINIEEKKEADQYDIIASAPAPAPAPAPALPRTEAHDNREVTDSVSPNPSPDSASIKNAAIPSTSATTATAPPAAATAATATSTSSVRQGFFSRIGGGEIRLGDVYDMAQKRAVQMREQALTEVEKLRQQQLQKKREEEIFSIPPSTGTLIIVDPVINNKSGDGAAEGIENSEDSAGGMISSSKLAPTASTKVGTKSSLSIATISSPLRDAFNIARQKSTDAASQLIFPIDTLIAPKDSDESSPSHNSSSEYSSFSGDHSSLEGSHDASVEGEEGSKTSTSSVEKIVGNNSSGLVDKKLSKDNINSKNGNTNNSGSSGKTAADTVAVATSTLTPTRFTEATSSVFNAAVGRYRRLKDNATSSSPRNQQPSKTEVVVGGADRVGGLRNFQLEDIIDDINAAAVLTPAASRILPPPMPLSSKVSVERSSFGSCYCDVQTTKY